MVIVSRFSSQGGLLRAPVSVYLLGTCVHPALLRQPLPAALFQPPPLGCCPFRTCRRCTWR